MCISSGPSYAAPQARDTSKDEIKSMYELTPEQIEENKRRRRMMRKPRSLLNEGGDRDSFGGASSGSSSGTEGLGGIGDASGGMARV
jgi:DNA-binding PadR family transcriptional regulator